MSPATYLTRAMIERRATLLGLACGYHAGKWRIVFPRNGQRAGVTDYHALPVSSALRDGRLAAAFLDGIEAERAFATLEDRAEEVSRICREGGR